MISLNYSLTIHILFSLFLSTLFFVSCKSDTKSKVEDGKVEQNNYSNKELGWTISIPKDWKIMQQDRIEKFEDTGLEVLEEIVVDTGHVSELKHLIYFQKDNFNIFQSTAERYHKSVNGPYAKNNQQIKDLLYTAIQQQGLGIDTSSTIELIDGVSFDAFHSIISVPNGNRVFYQIMYSAMINGYDFSATLNYSNDANKEVLLKSWRESKFKKKR